MQLKRWGRPYRPARVALVLALVALSLVAREATAQRAKQPGEREATESGRRERAGLHDGERLHREGEEMMRARNFDAARKLFEQELAFREGRVGSDHPGLGPALTGLAEASMRQGSYVEAETSAARALAIREKAFGAEHLAVAASLNQLGNVLRHQRRLPEAEALLRRALAIRERMLGPSHPDVAASLYQLAECLRGQAHFAEAEEAHRRALVIRESATDERESALASSLIGLAEVLRATARYDEAAGLLRRAVSIREQDVGPEHPDVAAGLASLGEVLKAQAQSAEAETVLRRALAIYEKASGPEDPKVAEALDILGQVLQAGARFGEAEPLLRRALTIREKALPPDHPLVGASLTSLAALLSEQARFAEAEALLRRGVGIRERALGRDHPAVAASLLGIGDILREQRQVEAAAEIYRRAIAIREKAFGPEHPSVAAVLVTYGVMLDQQGRIGDATAALERAVAIQEKALGPDHPRLAAGLNALGQSRRAEGRLAEAETLVRRAIAIRTTSLGADHPNLAASLGVLAGTLRDEKRFPEALEASRQATQILTARYGTQQNDRSESSDAERLSRRPLFARHVGLLASAAAATPALATTAADEGLRTMQLAGETRTARALAGMAARFASGNDRLAGLIRERQDLAQRWQTLDRALLAAVSEARSVRDPRVEDRMRKELSELDGRIGKIDRRLASDFPQYAEVANPSPLGVAEVQKLLGGDEALVTWLIDGERGYVLAARQDRVVFSGLPIKAGELLDAVTALRAGLEPPERLRTVADLPAFDTVAAHALYRKLFDPVEPLLSGARHVFVVPDGAMQSLPLGVLVTEPPGQAATALSDYASVPWLARRAAMSVLPAVSSLRALRLFAERSKAARAFAGFGDPVFTEPAGSVRAAKLTGLFRGGLADVDALRRLPRLPETALELKAQARALKAPESSTRVGALATEAEVKRSDLQNVRVIAFATHGLIAGDIDGLVEPALALSPPKTASDLDDGLLTASEVARLKLNADWVVLSACNTAAADGSEGASGLSGLAKAFFFAGARSLLVSHWPVNSVATVDLTTGAFRALEADPLIGRAEALRLSMLQMMDTASGRPEAGHYAHPMFWAPFVLVGEGAAGR